MRWDWWNRVETCCSGTFPSYTHRTDIDAHWLRVNAGKTKVMCCKVRSGQVEDSGKWPCARCRKGVGVNSIACTRCGNWVHKRCSGVKGSLNKVVSFMCSRYVEGAGEEEGKHAPPFWLQGRNCVEIRMKSTLMNISHLILRSWPELQGVLWSKV